VRNFRLFAVGIGGVLGMVGLLNAMALAQTPAPDDDINPPVANCNQIPDTNAGDKPPPAKIVATPITADLLDGTRAHVLAVIEHATRRIRILGVTLHPTGEWTTQQARNLIMDIGEQAHQIKFMIRDRGSNFTASFDAVFQATGTRILRTAVQAPRMNATCERLVGTLRRELLDRVLILGERHLHAVLTGYQAHYNTARPHQGIAQHVPDDERDGIRGAVTDIDTQQVRRKPILNGLINEYTRAA